MASTKKNKLLKLKKKTKHTKDGKNKRKSNKRMSLKKKSGGNKKRSLKYDTYYKLLMQNRDINKLKKKFKNKEIETETKINELCGGENNKIGIVLIYADWCGHCQSLRPIWNDMIEQIDDNKYDVIEINSDNQDEGINNLKNKYHLDDVQVNGYPTIGSIKNNQFTHYTGGRSIDDLMKWTKTIMKN